MPRWAAPLAILALFALFAWWTWAPPLPGGGAPAPGPAPVEREAVQEAAALAPFRLARGDRDLEVTPLAHYRLSGVVMSTERYRLDPSAPLSPVDFCLAWGGLIEGKLWRALNVGQGNRWCTWAFRDDFRYDGAYITAHAANTHIVPANAALRAAALRVRRGDFVELEGELVAFKGRLKGIDDFAWASSLSRTDEGDGACEVLWLTRLHFRDREWSAK